MQRKLRQFAWALILTVGASTFASLPMWAQHRDGGHSAGHNDRDRGRDQAQNRDRDRDRNREVEREREREVEREREREVERERERDHERHRGHNSGN